MVKRMICFTILGYKDKNETVEIYVSGWDVEDMLKEDGVLSDIISQIPYTQKVQIEVVKVYYKNDTEEKTDATEEELSSIIEDFDKFASEDYLEIESTEKIDVWGTKSI